MELPSDYFIDLHRQNNSALRLLHYPRKTVNDKLASEETKSNQSETENGECDACKIRCRPHSDYGSITLLLTDGVPGLQALIDEEWVSIPHVKGALVVNIGSLLSDWTNGKLLATLHRVVAQNESKPQTSLAFFADPNRDNSTRLKNTESTQSSSGDQSIPLSVSEYIQWQSG